MDTFNLFRGETSGDESDPPGFRARSAQLAPKLEASRLGMTVYHVIRRSRDLDDWDGERR